MPSSVEILWHHRRRLLMTAAPPLVAAWIIDYVVGTLRIDLIINGEPQPGTGPLIALLIWVPAWLIAFSAAIGVAAGGMRGVAVSPISATRWALRNAGSSLAWLMVVAATSLLSAGAGLVLYFCTGGLSAVSFLIGPVLSLVALLIGGVVLGRPVMALPVRLLERSARPWDRSNELFRGRHIRPGVAAVLVLVIGPLLGVWLATAIREVATSLAPDHRVAGPLMAAVGGWIVLLGTIVFVMAQACAITRAFLAPRDEGDGRAVADLAAVDATLAGLAPSPERPAWPDRAALAGLAVPLLLMPLLPLANPMAVPVVATKHFDVDAQAVGFAADGNPIIVDRFGVTRCADPACARSSRTETKLHFHAAYVRRDGTFVALTYPELAIDGSKLAPRYHDCTADGACTSHVMPIEGISTPSAAAIVPFPEGGVLVAFAQHRGASTAAPFTVWRCWDDSRCRSLSVLDPTEKVLPTENVSLTAGLDNRGLPAIAWIEQGRGANRGGAIHCDTSECGLPNTSVLGELSTTRFADPASIAGIAYDATGQLVLALRRPAEDDCFEWCFGFDLTAPSYSVARCDGSCDLIAREVTVLGGSWITPPGRVIVAVAPSGALAMMFAGSYDTTLVTCLSHCDLPQPGG